MQYAIIMVQFLAALQKIKLRAAARPSCEAARLDSALKWVDFDSALLRGSVLNWVDDGSVRATPSVMFHAVSTQNTSYITQLSTSAV